jgi:stage V sporulation protein AE
MPDILRLISVFAVGGFVSVIAQILIDLTKLTPARILVLFVSLGVFLGAVGLYSPIFDFAGAGISVPLIGFGGSIAEGVKEAIDKEGFIGIFKGPFTAAAAGCSAALVFGYIISLIFKGKPKRS